MAEPSELGVTWATETPSLPLDCPNPRDSLHKVDKAHIMHHENCSHDGAEEILAGPKLVESVNNRPGSTNRKDEVPSSEKLKKVTSTVKESPEDDKLQASPIGLEDVPDWRPASLDWAPPLVMFMLTNLIAYAILYVYSKFWGVVASSDSRWNFVFSYGPAFLAVIIREVILRIATDLESVLPYIACVSKPTSSIRWKPFAQFTEPLSSPLAWAERQLQRTGLMVKFCTFLFVPIQSSLLSHATREYKTYHRDFQVVSPNDMFNALNQSRVPGLALESIWHGQPVTDIKWITPMSDISVSKDFMAIRPDYAGVMPFTTEYNKSFAQAAEEQEIWTVDTSAIYGYLNCTQVDDINLFVDQIWLGATGMEIDKMDLSLTDRQGCTFDGTWSNLSSSKTVSTFNPITRDGKFAIWQTLNGHEKNKTQEADCHVHKHFIASGPLTIPFTNDAPKKLKKGFTGKGSGWAALSCVPGYRIAPSSITYTVDPQTQSAQSHDSILLEEGEDIGVDEERLNEPLERNTLSNGLVYNLSSPVFRRTFWNAPSPNAFITRKDLFAKWYENFDVEGCRSVSTKSNIWTNENACQMYANIATLWPVVVAGTVSVSALYVPDDVQQTKTGRVISYRKGWYLTGFELIATILLHTAVLLLLIWQHILHWDKGVPRFVKFRFKNGLRSPHKTGLYGTASSIAGRAFVFQDKSLQPLFEGLDAMKPSQAIIRSESRFARTKLLLRKWRSGADDGDLSEHETTFAKIRPAKDIKEHLEDRKKESGLASLMVKRVWKYLKSFKCIRAIKRKMIRRNTADQAARRLRYGRTPKVLHPILLAFIFSSTVTIIAIVIQYVLLSKSNGFQMWFQPTYPLSRTSSHEVRRYIQKALFKGLPAFILIGLGYWWEAVERYYRTTEPYVALSRGATGKMSVCLDYVHSMHIVTALKALMNSHFLLFYVTYTTVAVKVCIILASGIFSMDEIGSLPGRDFPLTRDWRTKNFPDELEADFVPSLRTFTMSRAVFGYPQTAGWQSESQDGRAWVFPSVEPDGRQFQMNLTGISANLRCTPANTTFNVVNGSVTATIQDKICSNATWQNICSSPTNQSSNADPRSLRASCMLWRYVEDSSCQASPSSVKGRWWIVSLNGTSTASSSNPRNIMSGVSNNISLLCEPRIWDMTASLTTTQKSDGFWITTWSGDNIKRLASERWIGAKNTSLNFDAFSSRVLNDTFTGELFRTSDDGWLDRFSIMSILGSKRGSSAFYKNASAVAEAASMTYSHAFAALISQNLHTNETSGNSSLLLEWIAPTTGDRPRSIVHALPFANMATVDRRALYAAILILGMYSIAIFFVWPRRKRRMPLDIAYTANAMSMVYDSKMLEIIRQSKECKDFKCLQDRHFAIGCYKGLSSEKLRLGIDVKERVQEITQHTLPFFHSRTQKEHNDVTAME